ncbi:bZIP transcription factor 50 [Magnolia sinica]|uniref:bZIP transcription factor 50 n=1 Tax=Magnolia sinica TaxID=86752 RepID=UPI002658E4D2|nr:bZIP transcription factor 50 [Magnolia sinica]
MGIVEDQDQDQGIPRELDWENLLESIPDSIDLFADFLDLLAEPCVEESTKESSNPSPVHVSSCINDVEQFLLEDNEEIAENRDFYNDFFSDILLDVPSDARSDDDVALNGENPSQEANSVEEKEEMEKSDFSEEKIVAEDDQMNKKRKRQMRNRDSAMKSRERKKLYVRDLELKSRYLEAECKRLEYALRCCVAENQILHQRLHNEKGLGVSVTKQESAVLTKESLLLGSLFWLMSIVCLFLLPGMKPTVLMGNVGSLGGSNGQEIVVEVRQTGNEKSLRLGLGLVHMRRRCKATRTKMKRLGPCLHSVFG